MGITDPTEAYFKDGLWSWDGTRWRKQPFLFGFSELAGEDLVEAALDAGTNYLTGAAVASGEIMVVRQVALRYVGTAPSYMFCYPVGAPGNPIPLAEYSVVTVRWYYATCFIILEAGDRMQAVVAGATADDSFQFRYSGYKMSIVE